MKRPHPSENPESWMPGKKVFDLTPSEWKVLLQVADDLTTAEIAKKLCLTPKSVENYRTRIGAKLDLAGRHKLAKFARKYAEELERCYQQQLQKLPLPRGTKLQIGAINVPIN